MSAAPLCPVHQKPMRRWDSQRGAMWTCNEFIGQGVPGANRNGYCNQKMPVAVLAPGTPQAPAAQAAPVQTSQAQSAGSLRLQAAQTALQAAAAFHDGDGSADVLETAAVFYHWLKNAAMKDIPAPAPKPAPPPQDLDFSGGQAGPDDDIPF